MNRLTNRWIDGLTAYEYTRTHLKRVLLQYDIQLLIHHEKKTPELNLPRSPKWPYS